MAGGAFLSILRVAAFFSLIWTASRISRFLQISSIVLEIGTGFLFSPSLIGLMPKSYTECSFEALHDCATSSGKTAIQDLLDESEKCDYQAYLSKMGAPSSVAPSSTTSPGSATPAPGTALAPPVNGQIAAGAAPSPPFGIGRGPAPPGPAPVPPFGTGLQPAPAPPLRPGPSPHPHPASQSGGTDRRLFPLEGTRPFLAVPATALHAEPRRLVPGGKGKTKWDNYATCLEKSCKHQVAQECKLTPDIFTFIGHLGVALMIFESGMHFSFERAREVGGWACVIALLGTVLPVVFGTLAVVVLIPGSDWATDGLTAGVALAPTNVGIALKLLVEADQLLKTHGQVIITAAFIDDILSLVLFNVVFSTANEDVSFNTFVPAIIGLILMMLVCIFLATGAERVTEKISTMAPMPKLGHGHSPQDEFLFIVMILTLLIFGTAFYFTGTHLWGCILAGMVIGKMHRAHHLWATQTKRLTVWMIRIFFGCTVAFSIPKDQLISWNAFWKGAVMGVGPCVLTKVCSACFMRDQAFVIGWAMAGRAEFAYLIAQSAAASNIMSKETYAVVIWGLLWATFFTPLVFRFVLRRFIVQQRELAGIYATEEEIREKIEFRASGHLPYVDEIYKDFIPSEQKQGENVGYAYKKDGPFGAGYYKVGAHHDSLPLADLARNDSPSGPFAAAHGPSLSSEEFLASSDNKAPSELRELASFEKPGIDVMAEPELCGKAIGEVDVASKLERCDLVRHDGNKDNSQAAGTRGSGFLCCLWFERFVVV